MKELNTSELKKVTGGTGGSGAGTLELPPR
ncbi:hypothetical protein N473_19530 [Pseudoalteromonas luteoviolacea CPMOR-1]|uniref:Bacteriocin n=1 Tax=Pseudoalteromonas luteoviolacea CPMOR-1 TaxID=1365248 RepID=A0A167KC59_9GAMM|nr:hypothetical protein N473_19530 [Pseudoalteromonas luteoviolacea CPMOR-1]